MALLIDRYVKKRDPLSPSLPQSSGLLIDRYVSPKPVEVTPTKESKIKKLGTGAAKFAARTGVAALGLGATLLDFTADVLSTAVSQKLRVPRNIKDIEKSRERAQRWQDFYESAIGPQTEKIKSFTKDLRKIEFIQPSERWSKLPIKEKMSKENIGETILNLGPEVVASIGAFAISGPLGFAASAASVGDEVRTIAMENGVDKENAELIGLGTGLIVGRLEKIVPDKLFTPQGKKKFIGGFVTRMVKTGLTELGTEVVQEDVQIAVESTLREDISMEEIIERNVLAGLGGLLGGVGASGTISFINNIRGGEIGGRSKPDLLKGDEDVGLEARERAPLAGGKRQLTAPVELLISHEGAPDAEAVAEHKADIEAGKTIEPVKVIREGKKYGIEDGKHRFQALKESGVKDIPIEIVGAPQVSIEEARVTEVFKVEKKKIEKLPKTKQVERLKAVGLETEAIKRAIAGESTDAEVKKTVKFLDSTYDGKKVTVAGKKGTATGKTSFGRHEIKFEDGSIKFIASKSIESEKVTTQSALDYLKNKALIRLGVKERALKIVPKKKVEKKPTKKKKVTKVPEKQLPVGEGEKKVSRLAARAKGKLDVASEEEIEKLGLATFNQVNKKENIAKAAKVVVQDPDEALRMVKGEIDPPRGILVNSIFVALHELGSTDVEVALKVASLGATRMGQEISVLSEILKDSPVAMMADLVNVRVEAFEKRTGKKASDKIKSERKKVDEAVKPPNTRQWDTFLKEILC